jgi:hypothetical protein
VSATRITQEQLFEARVINGCNGPFPTVLLQAALQPVARGGQRHFIAGNIRIISFARLLLEDENMRMKLAGNDQLDGPSWTRLLEAEFGIESEEQGDEWKEAIFTGNQSIYKCPNCPMSVEI